MVDYASAFKKGIAAAEKAQQSREEIKEAFAQFASALSTVSEGKIKVHIREMLEKSSALEALAALGKSQPKYQAIVAWNPLVGNEPYFELARWHQARAGYPCNIKYNNQDHSCINRQGLEASLADLLTDSGIGEKLQRLQKLQPAAKAQ